MTKTELLVFAVSAVKVGALTGGCSLGGQVLPLSLGSLPHTRSRRHRQKHQSEMIFLIQCWFAMNEKGQT